MLPNIYKFPLIGLPENESYSGQGDDQTCNFPWNLWRKKFNFFKTEYFKVFNSTCVRVAADTIRSQIYPHRKRQEHPKDPIFFFWMKQVFCRIFDIVLMNSLHNSFTAHLGLPLFLARCILSTRLSLIPACTSPLFLALRFDSPDQQLQWREIGGTVVCQRHKQPQTICVCKSQSV